MAEFELQPLPFMDRRWLLAGYSTAMVATTLGFAVVEGWDTWVWLPIVIVAPVLLFSVLRMNPGIAKIDPDRLTVEQGKMKQIYEWRDVTEIGVSDPPTPSSAVQRFAMRLFVPQGVPVVELRLKRGIRLNLPTGRLGSAGIPLGSGPVRLYLRDPHRFIEHARLYCCGE